MTGKVVRQILAEDWLETDTELDYLERLMRGDVGAEEEARHTAITIASIESSLAQQRVTLARIENTLEELEAWRRQRLMH